MLFSFSGDLRKPSLSVGSELCSLLCGLDGPLLVLDQLLIRASHLGLRQSVLLVNGDLSVVCNYVRPFFQGFLELDCLPIVAVRVLSSFLVQD